MVDTIESSFASLVKELKQNFARQHFIRKVGHVVRYSGLSIHVGGLQAQIGELCKIKTSMSDRSIMAEVVALEHNEIIVMPFGSVDGLSVGAEVTTEGQFAQLLVSEQLLGRVIDGFGKALDDRPEISEGKWCSLKGQAINPMQRPRIAEILETGVRSIDGLLTLGKGQRVGIFAGSGVGKSTLMGMIAKHVKADVNVIALIGERGREVREFIEKQLGEEGLKRSIVVVATSDQPALSRIRAAYAALTISEYFRAKGQQVFLMMDSITRLALARREVGLASGEPPTARGFTPSVFAELPEICERCGTGPGGGAITALMTVLVEGDDFNEPVSDSLRSILDGHIVLSRQIAHKAHYPAIDVLKSVSRVLPDIVSEQDRKMVAQFIQNLSLLEKNRQMVEIGAYQKGANAELDAALLLEPQMNAILRQNTGGAARNQTMISLNKLFAVGQA